MTGRIIYQDSFNRILCRIFAWVEDLNSTAFKYLKFIIHLARRLDTAVGEFLIGIFRAVLDKVMIIQGILRYRIIHMT